MVSLRRKSTAKKYLYSCCIVFILFFVQASQALLNSLRQTSGMLCSSVKCAFRSRYLRNYPSSFRLPAARHLSWSSKLFYIPGKGMDSWEWVNDEGLLVSPQDDRKYRTLLLDNGLRAMIIHDEKAKKGAASMAVNVGAASDPENLPGLAHFCEHMLFLGTEKYPKENTYKAFLNENGGRSNASTSMDMTVYQFDVGAGHLRQALDIFGQFFRGPLFTASCVGREMNAVDSEDAKNRTDDGRRFWQVMKAVADPSHPYAKFSTGNVGTLTCEGVDTREELMKFHGEHYYAENMALCVLGTESLDDLEALVQDIFSDVRCRGNPNINGDANAASNAADAADAAVDADAAGPWGSVLCGLAPPERSPFPAPSRTQQLVRMAPLREKRELQVQWSVPPALRHYRASPAGLAAHLLGHEGAGSAFAALQDRGWALALAAGLRLSTPGAALLQVKITLTEEGEAEWQAVLGTLFSYLPLLQNISNEECGDSWKEYQTMRELGFRYQQKVGEYSYATSMARRLLTYPRPHVLAGGSLQDQLNPELFRTFVERLTPENANIFHISKNFEGQSDAEERWYGVPYTATRFSTDDAASWQEQAMGLARSLKLPSKNPYIPDDFIILSPKEEDVPPPNPPTPPDYVITEQGSLGLELWHKMDCVFNQPRATFQYLLANQVTQQDPVAVGIMVRAFLKSMQQRFYAAEIAGLGYGLSSDEYGLVLAVSGYAQRGGALLLDLARAFAEWEPDARTFEMAKEAQIKSYKNWKMNRPDSHASYFQKLLIEPEKISVPNKLKQAESIQLADIVQIKKRVFEKLFVQGIVHGNISADKAADSAEKLIEIFSTAGVARLPKDAYPQKRIGRLPSGSSLLYCDVPNDEDENSAILSFYEYGAATLVEHMRLYLLAQMLKEPAFTQLRTKEQIGYIVFSGVQSLGRGISGVPSYIDGFYVKVLSKTHSPVEISRSIESFLSTQRQALRDMSEDSFKAHVNSAVMKMREPCKNLSQETSLHWREITENAYLWDRYEKLANILESEISLDSIINLADDLLAPSTTTEGGGKSHLEVMVFGKNHKGSIPLLETELENSGGPFHGWRVIKESNIMDVRRTLELHPGGMVPLSLARAGVEGGDGLGQLPLS